MRDEISADDRAVLADFVRGLPGRFEAIDQCGIRDTLVHGDFHPGNFRGNGRALTLLDWGDNGVGHPLLYQPAFFDAIPEECVEAVRAHGVEQWRAASPRCDPARASIRLA